MADANFNLSRQIASLDKLHTSMLELLEDVESLQTKMDKSLPELRHEISKLEFTSAQLTVEESLLREEGKNVARSVQAMAVSVSTLQDERDANKQMQVAVAQLRGKLDRLESVSQDMQRAVMQQQKQRSAEHKVSCIYVCASCIGCVCLCEPWGKLIELFCETRVFHTSPASSRRV